MTIKSIIDLIRTDASGYIIVFLVLSSLIEISPIKINPISAFCKWISSKFNQPIIDKIDSLEKKLDNHISESDEQNVRERRKIILNFGTSLLNQRKHSKEEFDFIISECDKYELYCKQNGVPNGVADATMTEIKRAYAECMRNNSFLQPGGDNDAN